jgi:hypothetical protein
VGRRCYRWLLSAVAAVTLGATPAAQARESGAPPGLGPGATLYWKVDALVRDKFGSSDVCIEHYNVLARAPSPTCGAYYVRLFKSASHSTFRLVNLRRNPLTGINVVPIRFFRSSGPYVRCGPGRYLALTNARIQLWPVDCVKP